MQQKQQDGHLTMTEISNSGGRSSKRSANRFQLPLAACGISRSGSAAILYFFFHFCFCCYYEQRSQVVVVVFVVASLLQLHYYYAKKLAKD